MKNGRDIPIQKKQASARGSDTLATNRKDAAGEEGRRATRRGPGRPPGKQTSTSRSSILRISYKLAKTVPLQDLSIVVVAKALGVTPSLIHYYIGGRDWLTSGTMNLFYRDLSKKMPGWSSDWKRDFARMGTTIYQHLVTYAGIASYMVSHAPFRIFQLTAYGKRDFGVEVLEKVASCVGRAGCSPERTDVYTHLTLDFCIFSAQRTVRHLFPSDHWEFINEKMAKLYSDRYPALSLNSFAPEAHWGDTAFKEGMRLFMIGLEMESNSSRTPNKGSRTGTPRS